MPDLALRRCSDPTCTRRVASGRCPEHATAKERERGTTAERGLGGRWRKLRAVKLAADPLCQINTHCEHPTLATEVDHIIPRSVRQDLCYDFDNLQSACKPCNSAKGDRENASNVNEKRSFPVVAGGFRAGLQTSAIESAAA